MWDFWNMLNGESATLIFDNKDFSNRSNSILEFSYAHVQVGSELDSLLVLVSTDCAQTWTTVFSLAGADLSTAANHSSNTFYPTANEWDRAYVDLNSYNGLRDVMIAFKGISDYGNNLFIDDVNMNSNPLQNTVLERQNFNFTLYPNPAYRTITLDVESDNNAAISCRIVNVLGQSVYSSYLTNKNSVLNIAQLPRGTYFAIIEQANKTANQRFTIK
jgi:hypothetical protein